jgi:hypothetical protein
MCPNLEGHSPVLTHTGANPQLYLEWQRAFWCSLNLEEYFLT